MTPALLLLLACTGASPDSGASADTGAAAPACASAVDWQTSSTPFPSPRNHHLTLLRTVDGGPVITVIGGFTDPSTLHASVYEAPILADGSLGDWVEQPALPAAVSGSAGALFDNRPVVVGGRGEGGGGYENKVESYVATVDASGAITGWTPGPDLPEARFHASGMAVGDTLLVLGGVSDRGTAQADVFAASWTVDGLGAFEALDPLPAPRSHHAAAVRGDRLVLSGGFSGNAFQNDTDWYDDAVVADLDADGRPTGWTTVGSDLGPRATHAIAVDGDCAYVVAGLLDDPLTLYTDTLALSADGAVATPLAGSLAVGRSHLYQVPVHDGRLYVVSGKTDPADDAATVEIGTLSP